MPTLISFIDVSTDCIVVPQNGQYTVQYPNGAWVSVQPNGAILRMPANGWDGQGAVFGIYELADFEPIGLVFKPSDTRWYVLKATV